MIFFLKMETLFNSLKWQLMALLLLRHAMNLSNNNSDDEEDDPSAFFFVSKISYYMISHFSFLW